VGNLQAVLMLMFEKIKLLGVGWGVEVLEVEK